MFTKSIIALALVSSFAIAETSYAKEYADVYKDKQIYTTPAMLSDLRSETARLKYGS